MAPDANTLSDKILLSYLDQIDLDLIVTRDPRTAERIDRLNFGQKVSNCIDAAFFISELPGVPTLN